VTDQGFAVQVALYQPEIPPNTGNIIRLCANTGAGLSLIGPLGFELDDRRLRRAGLDYHEYTRLQQYTDYAAWCAACGGGRVLALSTQGQRGYADVQYRHDDILLFGPETRGLPEVLLSELPPEQRIRVPMRADSRSLNLSNTVAVVVYEAWRQLGFCGGG